MGISELAIACAFLRRGGGGAKRGVGVKGTCALAGRGPRGPRLVLAKRAGQARKAARGQQRVNTKAKQQQQQRQQRQQQQQFSAFRRRLARGRAWASSEGQAGLRGDAALTETKACMALTRRKPSGSKVGSRPAARGRLLTLSLCYHPIPLPRKRRFMAQAAVFACDTHPPQHRQAASRAALHVDEQPAVQESRPHALALPRLCHGRPRPSGSSSPAQLAARCSGRRNRRCYPRLVRHRPLDGGFSPLPPARSRAR